MAPSLLRNASLTLPRKDFKNPVPSEMARVWLVRHPRAIYLLLLLDLGCR